MDIEEKLCCRIKNYLHYNIRVLPSGKNKYRIVVHFKNQFIDDMIYAKKLPQNTMLDKNLQERIILDTLLTSLQLDIKYPLNGYSTRYLSCELEDGEHYESNYINDKLVCFTRNANYNIKFPLDVVNSEEIPPSISHLHRALCCNEDCEVDFYLRVVKALNRIYNCNIASSDSNYCVYSVYEI